MITFQKHQCKFASYSIIFFSLLVQIINILVTVRHKVSEYNTCSLPELQLFSKIRTKLLIQNTNFTYVLLLLTNIHCNSVKYFTWSLSAFHCITLHCITCTLETSPTFHCPVLGVLHQEQCLPIQLLTSWWQ